MQNGIRTEAIRVDLAENSGWADYVFERDYQLLSLQDLRQFISKNGHLPGVPSSEELDEQGIDIAEMLSIQMAKIEELSLYVLELEEKIQKLQTAKNIDE